tara:strand:- start:4032 stop:4637 length:606 start_codon:yes stop_codon:yes gene_type:complete
MKPVEMSPHYIDYYTTWSDFLLTTSLPMLIVYIVGVYILHKLKIKKRIYTVLFSVLKGIFIFVVVNTIAVLCTSNHLDMSYDKRFVSDCPENSVQYIPLSTVDKIQASNFHSHVVPVLIAIVVVFVLHFLRKYESVSASITISSSFVCGLLFIMTYLFSPTVKHKNILLQKINEIYLEPNHISLVLFISIISVGLLLGNVI